MSVILVLAYLLPVVSLFAAALVIALVAGLGGYSLYEYWNDRRVAASQVARAPF